MTLTFAPQPRPIDMGLLTLGGGISPVTRPLGLPPGERRHRLTSLVIPPSCTSQWSQDEITVLGLGNHMHLLGSIQETVVTRDGEYIGPVRRERHWDFNHQSLEESPVRTIRAGDQIEMACTYDSSGRNETTVFGDKTDEEMCTAFMAYYPKLDPVQELYIVFNDHLGLGTFGDFSNRSEDHITFCGFPGAPTIFEADLRGGVADQPACVARGDLTSDAANAILLANNAPGTTTTTTTAPSEYDVEGDDSFADMAESHVGVLVLALAAGLAATGTL